MARYKKDYKLEYAKEIVENLELSKENEHILYYIDHLNKVIDKQDEKLKEYKQFFKTLNKHLPNTNMRYGS